MTTQRSLRCFFALGLACSVSQVAWAQGSSVTGLLSNSLSREAIANAKVTIEELKLETTSGADGRFTFSTVPPGRYHVLVRAAGYVPHRSEVNVTSTPTTVDLAIDPELHYSEVLSVSPEPRSQFESYQPSEVLAGQDLAKELQATLGATIENQPGIALRSFGPGPARPVVRGLDGDRVLIVEDGLRMGDLSSQSGDHGVNINPVAVERIEVVRGPATLLYGANAIGGLVNVITNEIPRAPVRRPSGTVTFDGGSGAREAGGAGDITVGNGSVALHLAGNGRRSGDYRSPQGEVPNSFNRSGGAEAGVAYTSDNGYLGGSYAYDQSHYGIPLVEKGQTNLDPRRHTFTLRGEARSLGGAFDGVRGSFGVRRYRHDERDGDEIATSFKNDTTELELLGHHRAIGAIKGSIGGTVLTRSFSTTGEETLAPPVDQKAFAAYVYEEVTATPHAEFQFGARVDRTSYDPAGAPARDFTELSGSVGLLLAPTDSTKVVFSLARASRNPALEELYNRGPHAGNFAFEIGDPTLKSEHAVGFDASVRWQGTVGSGEVTYFINRIDNFIFRRLSGEVRDELLETFFSQGDARLQGIESHVDVRIGQLWVAEGGLDYVRGELTSGDVPLPRIPPLRGRLGLRFQQNAFQAGADGVFTAKQDRIYTVLSGRARVGETPTEGYNLLKLFAAYSFVTGQTTSTITARLDNVTDRLYRNHLNFLKDLAPEMGRSFRLIYSVRF